MDGSSRGGSDTLNGGGSGDILYRDAYEMHDARGGNDTLTANGGRSNTLLAMPFP